MLSWKIISTVNLDSSFLNLTYFSFLTKHLLFPWLSISSTATDSIPASLIAFWGDTTFYALSWKIRNHFRMISARHRSCLQFTGEKNLFLKKIRATMFIFLNRHLNGETIDYQKYDKSWLQTRKELEFIQNEKESHRYQGQCPDSSRCFYIAGKKVVWRNKRILENSISAYCLQWESKYLVLLSW